MKKIIFTGGGSAGHIIPNIAIIERIRDEADVCYIGTSAIEKQLIQPLKVPYWEISCPKLIRPFSYKNLCIPFKLKESIKMAEKGIIKFNPQLIFSKGGYVSLPVVLAAKKLKIPCLTHESDLTPGLANKLIAKKCEYVLTSFPETADYFKNGKFCGSPIKTNKTLYSKEQCLSHYGLNNNKKTILFLGGGSGSVFINNLVRSKISILCNKYNVLHLCGKGNIVDSNIKCYVQKEFENDMSIAYTAADIVISRAGSNTIFEILYFKKPSILIPLEGQTRGDQIQNAKYFKNKQLTEILYQKESYKLMDSINSVINNDKMKIALLNSSFENGNKNIIHEIRRFLV